jgi:phosphoglycolate phosphatase
VQFDAAIFDLDGTLADTLEDLADATNRLLSAERLPAHDYAWYRRAIGNGVRQLITSAVPAEKQTEETISTYVGRMMADYDQHCLVRTRLYDGIAEALSALRADGVRLAVNSNKPDEPTRRIVEALIAPGTFEAVVGARPDVPLKPDPAAALQISERLGIAPSRTAYIGDSRVDMLTATAAGMVAVGVSWGFRTKAELVENGAAAVLDHPRELLALRESPAGQ